MKLCILFLSSMKWRSEHEQCMQWYEEQFTHIFVLHAHITRRYAWWSPYCLRHNDSCRKLSKRSFEGSFVLITNHGVLLRIFAWSATIQTILYIWKDIWYAKVVFKRLLKVSWSKKYRKSFFGADWIDFTSLCPKVVLAHTEWGSGRTFLDIR